MRADRLLNILLMLQARGKMTAQTLASELGVSRRTILRDIDALSFARVPVYAEGGHHGGISLDENYRTTLTGLKDSEIRAFSIPGNPQLMQEIGLGETIRDTWLKLTAALPARQQSLAEQTRQRLYIDSLWWWQDSHPLPFWNELQTAVFEDRQILAVYERFDGRVHERVLDPYGLVAKASTWYLIASHESLFRIYRASRFKQVTILDSRFSRQNNFDLADFWQTHALEFSRSLAEYQFTLLIHPDRLNFIRWLAPGRWSVSGEPDENGWLTVNFQLESIHLAKMLVFGLGSQAVILDPPELKEAVIFTVNEILRNQG